jgi:hypothetical protein
MQELKSEINRIVDPESDLHPDCREKEYYPVHAGYIEVLKMKSGKVISIGNDLVCLFSSEDHFENHMENGDDPEKSFSYK